jgi:hypothetical protein
MNISANAVACAASIADVNAVLSATSNTTVSNMVNTVVIRHPYKSLSCVCTHAICPDIMQAVYSVNELASTMRIRSCTV